MSRREAVYLTVWLAVLAATELTARGATNSDAQDVLGIFVWAALAAVTALDHARQPLPMVAALVRAAKRLLKRLPIRPVTVSVDLRKDPPIEQGLPRSSEAALLISLVGLLGLAMVRDSLPVGLREYLIGVSPTLWFAVLGTIWAVALFCIAVMLQQPCAAFVREFSSSSRRARQASLFLFLSGLVWFSFLVPTWLPLTLAFACLAIVVVLSASRKNARLTLIFQEIGSERAPCSLDWTQFIAIRGVISALASGCLLLLMIGSSPLDREVVTSMPLTDLLGRFFAWALCLSSCSLFRQVLGDLASARRDDPGAADVPRLLLLGVSEDEREVRSAELAAAGFDSVFDERLADGTDVRVAWKGAPQDFATDYVLDEKWLTDKGYLRVLATKHQVLCRRLFRRGLARVFRAAIAERAGSGYWLAPHLWFFEGLKRDSEESEDEFSGPPFREVLPAPARRHFRRIMDALQIDLIFFEDGISYRHFDHVLDRIYELFDAAESVPRAEEYHFAGVSGLLVVIHEHGFGTKLRSGAFPKPDYRFLGRARILHIFRDRGGDVSDIEVPQLSGGIPDLMPALL